MVLDLRALIEVLGVLDRQRMEPEAVGQEEGRLGVDAVEVEPEELAPLEPLRHRVGVALDGRPVAGHDGAGRSLIVRPHCADAGDLAGGTQNVHMEPDLVDYGPAVVLLVVDLQNDFADPRGALYVKGGEKLVAFANHQIERAKDAGSTVVYTQDWHPPHTPHFAQDGGTWPVHCVAGTWGAEYVPGLSVVGPAVKKGTGGEDGYSGFSVRDVTTGEVASTDLSGLLSDVGARVIVVCGLALDYCVRETALDARRLGYEVVVLLDGVRPVEVHPGDAERAIDAMRAAGVTLR